MVNKYIQISIPYATLIKNVSKIENLTYLNWAFIEPSIVNGKPFDFQSTCNNFTVSDRTTFSSLDLSPLPVWPNFWSWMARLWAWTVCSFIIYNGDYPQSHYDWGQTWTKQGELQTTSRDFCVLLLAAIKKY